MTWSSRVLARLGARTGRTHMCHGQVFFPGDISNNNQ